MLMSVLCHKKYKELLMSFRIFLLSALSLLATTFLFSCSTITKKDCEKDMMSLGLAQGKSGSPKKYTEDLRRKCSGFEPAIDLEAYEKGFYAGWTQYCLPNRAFEMGKKSDRYFSFCPPEREDQFREKYLIGKHHFELKDTEADIVQKMNDIRPDIKDSAADYDDYVKLQQELERIKREIQALEIEGNRNTFNFR